MKITDEIAERLWIEGSAHGWWATSHDTLSDFQHNDPLGYSEFMGIVDRIALAAAPASAEPVAWAFFDQKGYEHFLRTGDRGFMSDISVVPDFVERKSKEHDITVPLYAGPEVTP